MTKHLRNPRVLKRLLAFGLATVLLTVLVDTVMLSRYEHRLAQHAAAPTYTVCHASAKPDRSTYHEKYFCSNEGCYSNDVYEMSVICAYQDGNTCAGIAKSLQEGIR